MGSSRASRFWLVLGVAVLAAGLRWGWQPAWQPGEESASRVRVDYWADLGHSLADGAGYSSPSVVTGELEPSALRVPVFPIYLSLVYRTPGGNDGTALLGQVVLDGLVAVCLTLLAMSLLGRWAGLLAGVLFALYVPEWGLMAELWSEPLYTLVLLGTLTALFRSANAASPWAVLLTGVLAGILAMTRPVGAPLALGLFLVFLCHGNRWRSSALLLAGFAVAVLPWVVRNWIAFDTFIPLDTTGGFNLYMGTLGQRAYVPYSELDPELVSRVRDLSAHDADRVFRGEALRTIVQDPAAHLVRSGKKLLIYLIGVRDPAVDTWPPAHRWLVNGGLLALAGIGFLGLRRRRALEADLLLAVVVFSALIHSQIVAHPRLFFPVFPAVAILAASGLARLAGLAGLAGLPGALRRSGPESPA